MQTIHFISILLHILAAVVWIGGMAFLGIVIVPALRRSDLGAKTVEVMHRSGVRFRAVGWVCFALLLVTGIVNLSRWGVGWERFTSAELWGTTWGHILAIKLALVAVAIALSGLHDFVIGPRATARLREQPSAEEARRLRRLASLMGRANLLVAIAIVALAIMLVRGVPV